MATNPFISICDKISNTRAALLKWSKDRFGKLKDDIALIRSQLTVFYDTPFSATPTEDCVALEMKLNELLHLEQCFWRQRAKVFWLTNGDLNTNFFSPTGKQPKKEEFHKVLEQYEWHVVH